MSLYGGIKFTAAELEAAALKDSQAEAAKIKKAAAPQLTALPVLGSTSKSLQKSKATAAVLAFAPRIKQPKPSGSSRPIGNYTSATLIEKKPDLIGRTEDHIRGVGIKSSGKNEDEIALGQDGRPLARAPAMTLAAGSAGGAGKGIKRDREEEKRRKKKSKKRKQQQQAISNFNPEDMYDPNRPNDLGEYQAYRKRARAEKKAQLVADKLRRDRGGSDAESSYYTDSEEEAPRRDAPKMFAPPRLYSPPASIAPRLPNQKRPTPPPEPSAPPPPPPGSEDPYARRAAMSQGNPYTAFVPPHPSIMPSFPPPPSLAPGPSFVPPPASDVPGFGGYQPPPPPNMAPPPQMPTFVAPQLGPSGDAASIAAAKSLEERKAAAAAIAAKFAALAGSSMPSAPGGGMPNFVPATRPPAVPREDETGTFAEKMMKRWGHVEGTGIGARSDGIVHALSAEHASSTSTTDPSKLSKRQQAKQKAASANAKKRKWVQAPNARGRIINANEEKAIEGEASRVVVLTGLVEGEEEVDEELSEEVGEECSKWGIVERVLLHMVEPAPIVPGECLRVFVVFSGLAGAWRATKELDGRFFGGRKIGVKYFDEAKFNAGERDGPIA